MRKVVLICAIVGFQWAVGQTGIGAFVAQGFDPHYATGAAHVGLRIEHRFSDSSSCVLRLSGAIIRSSTDLEKFNTYQIGTSVIAAVKTDEYDDIRTLVVLDTKWPLTSAECSDGYFRGAYAVAGAGVLHTVTRGKETVLNFGAGRLDQRTFISGADQWVLRTGAGLQRDFRWGGLFIELIASLEEAAPRSVKDVPGLGVVVSTGYRYVFGAKRPIPES